MEFSKETKSNGKIALGIIAVVIVIGVVGSELASDGLGSFLALLLGGFLIWFGFSK